MLATLLERFVPLAVVEPFTSPSPSPVPSPTTSPSPAPENFDEAANLVVDTMQALWESFLRNIPLVAVAFLLLALGVVAAGYLAKLTIRGLRRTGADHVVVALTSRLVRLLTIIAVVLLALSVAGLNVGAALATLGIAGLAVALALQSILENFVAGVVLLIRKPFRAGDQIRTDGYEGTVEEIDLRVTRIIDYDGELLLIPNAEVFKKPLTNLTRRGKRRTTVTVGIDYRDDHDRAREILTDAVAGVDGVLSIPGPEVLLTELGESSVNFELRYWTLPDIASVRRTQDRVLSAAKSAVEGAGMTIPWPIRTVSFDNPVRVDGDGAVRAPSTDR